MGILHPPAINAYPSFRKTFRFSVGTGITNQPVIGYDLLGLLGVATSTTGVRSIVAGVKIHSISIWASNSGTNQSTPDVFWAGDYQKPQKKLDTSIGSAEPAYVRVVPPPNSTASFWISYGVGAGTKFTITAPVGALVDLDAEIVLSNGGVTPTIVYVSSGLTLGDVVFGPLDHNTGTPRLIPVDVTYYG